MRRQHKFVFITGCCVLAFFTLPVLLSDERGPIYPWQKDCDNTCIAKLGRQADFIDSRNCEEMTGMLEAKRDMLFQIGNREEWFLAIEDKHAHDGCK